MLAALNLKGYRMAVDDTSKEYDEFKDEWTKCRNVIAGQREVHKAGVKYLPKLSGQTDAEYKAYKGRALFYEASGRTVDGMLGLVFRKDPNIEIAGQKDFLEDVTMTGLNIAAFARMVTREALSIGRGGVLVDFTSVDTSEMTAIQAQQAESRPFFKYYQAEDIINWKFEGSLREVRIKECIEVQSERFKADAVDQIRVLSFDEAGNYNQEIFRKSKNKQGNDEWVSVEVIYPKKAGQYLKEIPFFFIDVNGEQESVDEPPLLGLVNVNLSHYNNSADLEHGAHYTGLPTAVISGVTNDPADDTEYRIGSTVAWKFSDPSASAVYLEFTGKGLGTLQELMKEKELKMASLGAQMLTPETRRNEAEGTAAMRHMGENSVLASLANSISDILNKALMFAADWVGTSPASIELNTDFMPTPMTPQMMRELVMAWQTGAISYETLFENLKAGEIIDAEKTVEDEQSEIQTNDINL